MPMIRWERLIWHLCHSDFPTLTSWESMMVLGSWHVMWCHQLSESLTVWWMMVAVIVFDHQLLNLMPYQSHTGHRWHLASALFYPSSPVHCVCYVWVVLLLPVVQLITCGDWLISFVNSTIILSGQNIISFAFLLEISCHLGEVSIWFLWNTKSFILGKSHLANEFFSELNLWMCRCWVWYELAECFTPKRLGCWWCNWHCHQLRW